MDKLTMQITGMTCGHCVAGVTRALKGVPGVTVDQVAIITTAVEDEGYHVVSAA